MAYFTEVDTSRILTDSEQAAVASYVTAQKSAGTTPGDGYNWQIAQSENSQPVRMWGTLESANGYKNIFAGFSPSITVSVY